MECEVVLYILGVALKHLPSGIFSVLNFNVIC